MKLNLIGKNITRIMLAAFMLLNNCSLIFGAAAKAKPKTAAKTSAIQNIPTSVPQYTPLLNQFNASLTQATQLIQAFDPGQDNLETIQSDLDQAKAALNAARALHTNMFAGYSPLRLNSVTRTKLESMGINDTFFDTKLKLLNALDADLSQKEQIFLERAQSAEAEAAFQADKAKRAQMGQQIAQRGLARAEGSAQTSAAEAERRRQEALKERQLAYRALSQLADEQARNRQNLAATKDASTLRQMAEKAQAEADKWRLQYEATQKQLEKLAAEQQKITGILPALQQKASLADKSKEQIAKLRADFEAELKRMQQAYALEQAKKDDALQRALQEADGLRQNNAAMATLQTQMQQLQAHNEQLQAQAEQDTGMQDQIDKLRADLAAAQAQNQRITGLDQELERLRAENQDLAALRARNNELSTKAADADRLHDDQKKSAEELKAAQDKARDLQTRNEQLAASLAASKADDKKREEQLSTQREDLKRKDDALRKLEKEAADAAALRTQQAQSAQRIKELEAIAARVAEVTEQNTQLNDRVAEADEERKALDEARTRAAELETSASELVALRHEMEELRPRAADAQRIPQLEEQVARIAELERRAAQADQATTENQKLNAQLAQLRSEDQAHETRAKATADQLAQLRAANAKLEAQVATDAGLRKALEELQGQLDRANADNAKLAVENRDKFLGLEESNRKLAAELRQAQEQLTALRAQGELSSAAAQETNRKLQANIDQLNSEKATTASANEQRLAQLTAELTAAEAQAQAAAEAQAQLQSQLAALKSERDKANSDLNEATIDKKTLSEELEKQAEENRTLIPQLKALTVEHDALKASQTNLLKLLGELTQVVNENAAVTRQVTGGAGK